MPELKSEPVRTSDTRIARALQDEQMRMHTARSWLVLAISLGAGVLGVVVLGRLHAGAYGVWWLVLALTVGLRTGVSLACGRDPAPDAAGRWLPRLRTMSVLHGAVWGALAWAGPAPSDLQAMVILTVLQSAVAIGGTLMALSDRRAAFGFGLAVALPLAWCLVSTPAARSQGAIVAVALVALLMLMLWVVGQRAEVERRALIASRLARDDQVQRTRHSEAMLQRVFDHVGEGICMFDDALRLQAVNERMVTLLGLDATLVEPGTPLEAWVRHLAAAGEYGELADPEAEVTRRLVEARGNEHIAFRRQRPDGRTIEARRTPLPEGGFTMVCVDVTERIASADALFENQRTLEVLLQKTEEGFWFIDNQHRTTDANPAMCRMLGLSHDALVGRSIWEFVDAENADIFRRQTLRREDGQANTYEITLTRADGGHVVCVNNATPIHDAQGRKIGAIGLFSDVTAEREASAAARQAMALAAEKSRVLEVTLESLGQGVLGFDAELRLHSWNQRAIDLLELPVTLLEQKPTLMEIGRWQQAQGVFGEALERIEGAPSRDAVRRHLHDKLAAGDEPLNYRRTRQDGCVIEVHTHLGADGGQVRTYTDVTAERRAALALLAAKEEAERANHAKSEFLSRMSHELRTPLNAILGFGQLMERDAAQPLDAIQLGRLQQILQGGQHLLALINEVLDLARIETGTLSLDTAPVDVDALADECLRLIDPVARARPVRLHRREGGAGSVQADPTRLRQVLLNLLANAIKYNRPQGEVRLRCAVEGEQARVEVVDTGPGLDAAQQQRLFMPFERLDADRDAIEGTGIGLALSRSLVELMGGRIGVRSVPGEGSCFWILLPLARGESRLVHPRVSGPAAVAESTTALRVLYVEDNAVNQMVMQGMLAHRPHIELRLAATPEEGLAMAVAEQPDLVLLDIQLPGASGYEVLQSLRADARLQAVPVIAVSANAMPLDLDRAREAGFDDYLTKPLDLPELLATVDRWLARRAAG